MQAAAHILEEAGYDGFTTNHVARRAGVSIGSLYQYFPNKQSLIAALVERQQADAVAILGRELARTVDMPLRESARHLIAAMIELARLRPKLHRVLIEEVPRIGELARIGEWETQLTLLLRATLERERELLRKTNLDIMAFVLVQAVRSVTFGALWQRPDLLDDEQLVDELVELVVRYTQP